MVTEESIKTGLQEILDMTPPELGENDVIPMDVQEKMKAKTYELIDMLEKDR